MGLNFTNGCVSSQVSFNGLFKIILGLIAACCYGLEIILIKTLSVLNVDHMMCGYIYTMFVGFIGFICLFFYWLMGGLAHDNFTLEDYKLIFLGGIFESVGVLLQTISASIGIGGIAFGISNSCCVYVLLFNYFVMG